MSLLTFVMPEVVVAAVAVLKLLRKCSNNSSITSLSSSRDTLLSNNSTWIHSNSSGL
jgi:hypothetical protein